MNDHENFLESPVDIYPKNCINKPYILGESNKFVSNNSNNENPSNDN